jgi:hypothetical protein
MRIVPGLLFLFLLVVPVTAGAQSIGFDDVQDGTAIAAQYAGLGVVFEGVSGGPFAFGVFGSPASFRNYLVGEHEGLEDKNDSSEYGNGRPAAGIDMRFVVGDGKAPGVTSRVSMAIIYLNVGSRARVQAVGVSGETIAEEVVVGRLGAFAQKVELRGVGIARVRVRFERDEGFEDNAGIDDLSFDNVAAPPVQ